MTFPPLACDGTLDFLLPPFRASLSLLFSLTSVLLFALWISLTLLNIQTLAVDNPDSQTDAHTRTHTHTLLLIHVQICSPLSCCFSMLESEGSNDPTINQE